MDIYENKSLNMQCTRDTFSDDDFTTIFPQNINTVFSYQAINFQLFSKWSYGNVKFLC